MLKKTLIILGACSLGFIIACNSGTLRPETTDGDADADSDQDADDNGDSDTDTNGDNDADDDPDRVEDADDDDAGRDWPCEQVNATRPQFRVTSLQLLPADGSGYDTLQTFFDRVIDEFSLIWLIDLDTTMQTMTIGSGESTGEIPTLESAAFCQSSWTTDASATPVTDVSSTIVTGTTFATTNPIERLNLLVYASEKSPFTLPLRVVDLQNLQMNDERTLIGDPGVIESTELAQGWSSQGQLEAWISVAESVLIDLEGGGNLCSELCGADCTKDIDPTTQCPHPASTVPGSEPAELGFVITAEIGAASTTIIL